MSVIYQGDQYYLPIKITQNGVVIGEDSVSKVRIGVANFVNKYPDGDLLFSGDYWLFPLTEEMTYTLRAGITEVQAQVVFPDDKIISSMVVNADIGESLLKGAWNNGNG